MTIEEAGEIVLRGSPWSPCTVCLCIGRIKIELEPDQVECWSCKGEGHFLPADVEEAYRMLAVELPLRPLTPRERFAEIGGEFLRDRLNQPSWLRRMLPPQNIPDEVLAEYLKGKT